VQPLAELKRHPMVQEAGLLDEEILAMQLYTGVLLDPCDVSLDAYRWCRRVDSSLEEGTRAGLTAHL
jgi:hypothetical protein